MQEIDDLFGSDLRPTQHRVTLMTRHAAHLYKLIGLSRTNEVCIIVIGALRGIFAPDITR